MTAADHATRRARAIVHRVYPGHCLAECTKCTALVKAIAAAIRTARKWGTGTKAKRPTRK